MGGAGRRVALLRALFLALFVVLAARAAHLSVVTTRGEVRAKGQLEGVMVLTATRGLIVDRNGVELALTVHAPSIYVRPGDFDGNRKNLRALAKALGRPPSALAERLRGRKRFTFVGRWVSDAVAKRIEALELPGVGIVSEPRRAYPADELAGSLLGFANIDGKGVRGIEEQEDEWLRGSPIRTPVERDARGHLLARTPVAPLSSSGGDVALTIDMGMQAEAETALRNAIKKSRARGGCVITIDPHSGEILALAEAPGFNPNDFRKIKYQETRSAAFQDAVEPGSVFKAFLIAGALETGAISPNQVIDTGDGTLAIRGKTIRDHRPYGVIDPTGVLKFSSNVGAVKIAKWLGREAHYQTLERFGFGSRTGSGFPAESRGLLRPWQEWKEIDHATVAFGQGLGVTAIQLSAAMGVLAGDGQLRVPRLVSARRRAGGEWQSVAHEPARRAVTKRTAAQVLKMMESVVSAEGTGRKAALSGVRVAGKTGTAQKLDTARGAYSKTRYTAWFMGAAPADDPKLVIVAMLDEPKGLAHGGGDVAAPLFAKVAAGQLTRLGIVTRPAPIPAPPRAEMLARAKPTKLTKPKKSKRATKKPAVSVAKTPIAKPVVSAVSKPAKPPATPTTNRTARKPGTQVAAKRTTTTAVTSLPAVSAPPAGSAAPPASDDPVLMPDFRGETLDSVRRIATRNRLVLEVRGTGLAIDQQPTPGTVVVGSKRHVLVSFSDGGREG
ncbi:MAG: PASTA domain-containing protein [Deltaproteobacteria bacterium]|nr:PASTA domain-containing protein [Deltaproteobacteria bacterium]